MSTTLPRRLAAEGVGTAALAAVVVGSGIMAQRLTDDAAVQLLANSTATAGGLVALILALGWLSGAHFNPVVTGAEVALGGLPAREGAAYAAVQVVAACAGTMVANLMFDLPAVTASTHERTGGPLWLGEVVATFGLLLVILAVVRSSRPDRAAYVVAGYIAAAYWFTSSTSFANPAITVGRSLTDTFAGIAPSSVPAFVVAQVGGGALALGFAVWVLHEPDGTELVVERLDDQLEPPPTTPPGDQP